MDSLPCKVTTVYSSTDGLNKVFYVMRAAYLDTYTNSVTVWPLPGQGRIFSLNLFPDLHKRQGQNDFMHTNSHSAPKVARLRIVCVCGFCFCVCGWYGVEGGPCFFMCVMYPSKKHVPLVTARTCGSVQDGLLGKKCIFKRLVRKNYFVVVGNSLQNYTDILKLRGLVRCGNSTTAKWLR